MKTHEVFGITPTVSEYSYVDRGSLDKAFRKLIEREQTHVAIRGASKVGKSWLRQRVLSDNAIVIQCRLNNTTIDIYKQALARLGISLTIEMVTERTFKAKVEAEGELGAKLLAKVRGSGEFAAEYAGSRKEQPVGHDVDDLQFIASLIRESGKILVVEDFHYLPLSEQKRFSFDLKALWDYKTFVVIIGVWISENMLITLNPDLSDRIEELSVTWQIAELKEVFLRGCSKLNIAPSDRSVMELADISYESVGLLQKLALRFIDDELGIEETVSGLTPAHVDDIGRVHYAGAHVADQLNQLYQAFARRVSEGIRKRNNSTGIYAHAMAAIMTASDRDLSEGYSARSIFEKAHARQPRVQFGNLKAVLARFPELQVDEDGRGLVLAYDPQEEKVSVVDKQLLLYRRFATVKWPWEELIEEFSAAEHAFD